MFALSQRVLWVKLIKAPVCIAVMLPSAPHQAIIQQAHVHYALATTVSAVLHPIAATSKSKQNHVL